MEKINNKNLEQEIIKTIIWFDLFSHPLSSFEIFKFLLIPVNFQEVLLALDNLFSEGKIISQKGFFCLPGKERLIEERFKRLNYFRYKIKRARKFSKLLSILPFVQAVAIANIIGDHNLKKSSDIDMFVVSSPKRLWLCRFFCVVFAKFLGLRPNSKTKQDKICLSFYISSDNLKLERYLYNNKDIYFVYWLANLEFIFYRDDFLNNFWQSNMWLLKYLPNFKIFSSNTKDFKKRNPLFLFFSPIMDLMERIFKIIQLKILPQNIKRQVGKSSGIILEDNIIKLFLEDKRPLFINEYENNIKKNN